MGEGNGKGQVLVTGGAGYIGSHTCIELLSSGYSVVVLDCLDNGAEESLRRVRGITGCSEEALILEQVDLLEYEKLCGFFSKYCGGGNSFVCCIHFAGLKAVGESVKLPLHYYMNNLTGTFNLLNLLDQYGCHSFVFSSSATVYGDPSKVPIDESQPIRPTNPYGQTKAMIEQILADMDKSSPEKWSIALLRYFNPIGAHESGLIGEDPKGFPNNLLPFVCQVAVGKREKLSVFGNDWDTRDGTGVRDYIHVVDLAKGHVAAVKHVTGPKPVGTDAFNIGTGNGVSVLELVSAFGKACGKEIPYEVSEAVLFRQPSKIRVKLDMDVLDCDFTYWVY